MRCFSCGKVVGDKWDLFMALLNTDMEEGKALTELGLKRYCCRRMVLTHVDLIEKLLHYNSTYLPIIRPRAVPPLTPSPCSAASPRPVSGRVDYGLSPLHFPHVYYTAKISPMVCPHTLTQRASEGESVCIATGRPGCAAIRARGRVRTVRPFSSGCPEVRKFVTRTP